MWVGKMYYTTKQFVDEANKNGISKRINIKPKLKAGDWVYFVHPAAIRVGTAVFDEEDAPRRSTHSHTEPGVFLVARLTEIQKIISEDDAKDEAKVKQLEDQGIVPVVEYDETEEPETPVVVPEISTHISIYDDTPRDIRIQAPGRGTCIRCGQVFGFAPRNAKNPRYCPDCLGVMEDREKNTTHPEPEKKTSKKTGKAKSVRKPKISKQEKL
jgi:hypothetical protein